MLGRSEVFSYPWAEQRNQTKTSDLWLFLWTRQNTKRGPKSQRVFGQIRKPPKMFRAGLYARVSTNDRGQTVPLQIRALFGNTSPGGAGRLPAPGRRSQEGSLLGAIPKRPKPTACFGSVMAGCGPIAIFRHALAGAGSLERIRSPREQGDEGFQGTSIR